MGVTKPTVSSFSHPPTQVGFAGQVDLVTQLINNIETTAILLKFVILFKHEYILVMKTIVHSCLSIVW